MWKRDEAPRPPQPAAPTPAPAVPEPAASSQSEYMFMAVASFDFELPNDPSNDIQYVHFKANDQVKVIQTDDEWWFGEVRGQTGFFPHNYVTKI